MTEASVAAVLPGGYTLIDRISPGRYYEVWLAENARGRPVAVKLAHPDLELASEDALRGLVREGQILAHFDHPHVVRLLDDCSLQGFLVLELLGASLRTDLPEAGVPWPEVVQIGVQVARALEAVHAAGYYHRDVKPGNLLRSVDGGMKLIDFHIARRGDEHQSIGDGATWACDDVTSTGTVKGTAGYAAPEQVLGQVVDARSDVFALGATLYQLVCGRAPFRKASDGGTPTAAFSGWVEIAMRVTQGRYPPLDPEHLGIPPPLVRAIHTALERLPEDRFTSARELREELEAIT